MSSTFDFAMTEHAAWRPFDGGHRRVFTLPDGGRCLVTISAGGLALHPLTAGGSDPALDVFTLSNGLLGEVPELATALADLGTVARFRTASLWDAIGTAIIRQVIRAGQSRKLYRAFCEAHGEQVSLPDGGTYALFPSPEAVLALDAGQFSAIGMAFKRRPLRAAAAAYMEHSAQWRELSPHALTGELQTVPRIGPWTAHAAVADWSNDWALYPYGDLAVRTWARRAAPSCDWPADEAAFGQAWRTLAGGHLSSLTLFTLAWGSQHADIG
jgi:DNA-3-methyladenine glycosylase II